MSDDYDIEVDVDGGAINPSVKRFAPYKGFTLAFEYDKGEFKPGDDPNDFGYFMYADYGFIVGSVSSEVGEEMDFFMGPNPASDRVYLLPILNADGSLNEIKALFGFDSLEEAKDCMHSQYGYSRVGEMMQIPIDGLRQMVNQQGLKRQLENDYFVSHKGFQVVGSNVDIPLVLVEPSSDIVVIEKSLKNIDELVLDI